MCIQVWDGSLVKRREGHELREVIFHARSHSTHIVHVFLVKVWFYSDIITQHLFLDITDKQTGIVWAELIAHCDTAVLFVIFTIKSEGVECVQPYGVVYVLGEQIHDLC